MAAPIIPILKKVAVAVLTDKKLFKKVMGINTRLGDSRDIFAIGEYRHERSKTIHCRI